MKTSRKIYIIIGLILLAQTVVLFQLPAQKKSISQKKQEAILKKADLDYFKYKYFSAVTKYEKYLSIGGDDFYAHIRLADCYWQAKDYNNAFRIYKDLFPNGNHGAKKVEQLRIAELYARDQEYKKASEWLDGLDGYQQKASAYVEESALKSMMTDSLNWHVRFLNINTSYREFSPFIVDNKLLFSSNRPNRNEANTFEGVEINYDRLWEAPISEVRTIPVELTNVILKNNNNPKLNDKKSADAIPYSNSVSELYFSQYEKGKKSTIVNLVEGLKKMKYNVGTVSVDKNNHLYFTTNYSDPDNTGINRLRLVEAVFRKGSFKTKFLPFGNPNYCSVMHSAINQDGTLIVFSSDIANGKGGCDLYYAQRENVNKAWGAMKPLGANINTEGNEVFPTITRDGYLYFSSDALPGLGGLDIFRIPLQDALDGKDAPEHISYPVNSPGDDFGWTQDTTNTSGYFTSDRLNHNSDLYSFRYKKPVKMSYFDNKVLDRETMEPIEGATLFLLNKADGKIYVAKTDKNGKSRFVVPNAKGVIIKAMVKGFVNYCIPGEAVTICQPADTVQKASNSFAKEKLKINYAWKLQNIYYDFNQWSPKASNIPVLDSLIKVLNRYPISIEINSYTDSRGSSQYNYQLSLKRSESIVNYLVTHGINSSRLMAKGYGEAKLLNRCADGIPCSENDHKINRRTEIKVYDYEAEQKPATEDIDLDQFKDGDVINIKALPLGFMDECR
jgi:outer membrane protein OmpA-like peptidoglycan-associated protein